MARKHRDRLDMPGLEENAITMTLAELGRLYSCDPSAVWKRLNRMGLKARVQTPEERSEIGRKACAVAREIRASKPKPIFQHRWRTRVQNTTNTLSQADLAANYLRRDCPIYRCDEAGKPDFTGQHYRRGSMVMTAKDLMDLARRKGWNPDAWRIAA